MLANKCSLWKHKLSQPQIDQYLVCASECKAINIFCAGTLMQMINVAMLFQFVMHVFALHTFTVMHPYGVH